MNRNYAGTHYETRPVDVDKVEGRSTIELYRNRPNNIRLIAKITFWDAMGQFYLETWHGDIPLAIIEELIDEAKEKIKFR